MHDLWVPATKAMSLIARELGGEQVAAVAISERARAKLLVATAELFMLDEERQVDAIVPAEFWWGEGHEALEQDWVRGDFSTWIERDVEARAFGVRFDWEGLRKLLSPEKAAAAVRELSVASDPTWLSAKSARKYMCEVVGSNPMSAGAELIEACRLGFVVARAVLMQCGDTQRGSSSASGTREWDVPDWFWLNFTTVGSSAQDWDRGVFSGKGRTPRGVQYVRLSGVWFHKDSVEALNESPAKPASSEAASRQGRPRKEWWDDLWCAIWGQIVHGELTPTNQAEIEKAMLHWLEGRGLSAAESTIRPMAKKAWKEWDREAEN
jgi:hypothetical protein